MSRWSQKIRRQLGEERAGQMNRLVAMSHLQMEMGNLTLSDARKPMKF